VIIRDRRLVLEERPDPTPRDGELLIRVHAAGINNADLMQRAGHYPPPPGAPEDIPGLECAGEVVGSGARVMALLGGGGQAELAVVDQRHVLELPSEVSWPEAGGFMEAFATAHDALFTQAELRAGERLLVSGAAGGVGTAAVQLGVAAGCEVTGRSRAHHDRIAALGAATAVEGDYDVILELVGGPHLTEDVDRLAPHGRLVVIGTAAGSRAEIDFGRVMRCRARLMGSTLRSRSPEEKALVVQRLRDDVLPLLTAGRVIVPVHLTFPLDEAAEAYEAFAAGGKFGKLVIVG
jgi:NADPH:quinone reductase-like Zn-dependent oxidoreductase